MLRSASRLHRQLSLAHRSILRSFGFPIAGLGLAVALEFRLAVDRVAADLPRVLGCELLPVALAGYLERDFAILECAILNRGFLIVPDHGAGQLVALRLELERQIKALVIEGDGPLP